MTASFLLIIQFKTKQGRILQDWFLYQTQGSIGLGQIWSISHSRLYFFRSQVLECCSNCHEQRNSVWSIWRFIPRLRSWMYILGANILLWRVIWFIGEKGVINQFWDFGGFELRGGHSFQGMTFDHYQTFIHLFVSVWALNGKWIWQLPLNSIESNLREKKIMSHASFYTSILQVKWIE